MEVIIVTLSDLVVTCHNTTFTFFKEDKIWDALAHLPEMLLMVEIGAHCYKYQQINTYGATL